MLRNPMYHLPNTKLNSVYFTCPTELHVEAKPTFFSDNIVRAHPSTAMSWVAAQKFKIKKHTVKCQISGEGTSNIS